MKENNKTIFIFAFKHDFKTLISILQYDSHYNKATEHSNNTSNNCQQATAQTDQRICLR